MEEERKRTRGFLGEVHSGRIDTRRDLSQSARFLQAHIASRKLFHRLDAEFTLATALFYVHVARKGP